MLVGTLGSLIGLGEKGGSWVHGTATAGDAASKLPSSSVEASAVPSRSDLRSAWPIRGKLGNGFGKRCGRRSDLNARITRLGPRTRRRPIYLPRGQSSCPGNL